MINTCQGNDFIKRRLAELQRRYALVGTNAKLAAQQSHHFLKFSSSITGKRAVGLPKLVLGLMDVRGNRMRCNVQTICSVSNVLTRGAAGAYDCGGGGSW